MDFRINYKDNRIDVLLSKTDVRDLSSCLELLVMMGRVECKEQGPAGEAACALADVLACVEKTPAMPPGVDETKYPVEYPIMAAEAATDVGFGEEETEAHAIGCGENSNPNSKSVLRREAIQTRAQNQCERMGGDGR